MNRAARLIAEVGKMGGTLNLQGDGRIHYKIPATEKAGVLVAELRAHRKEIVIALQECHEPLALCGDLYCAGCYDVGDGRKIHPPRAGKDYLAWVAKWDGRGRVQ